jgi:hypothetical protein
MMQCYNCFLWPQHGSVPQGLSVDGVAMLWRPGASKGTLISNLATNLDRHSIREAAFLHQLKRSKPLKQMLLSCCMPICQAGLEAPKSCVYGLDLLDIRSRPSPLMYTAGLAGDCR